MQRDKRTYRRLKVIKSINHKNSKTIQLNDCPRVYYGSDMPLKQPSIRCCFRRKHKRECIPHSSLYNYLNDMEIEYEFNCKFKCVI